MGEKRESLINSYEADFNDGIIFKYEKKWGIALESFKRCYRAAPNDIDVLFNMGEILVKLKRFEDARFYLEKAVIIDPLDLDAKWLLKRVINTIKDKELKEEKRKEEIKPVAILDTNFLIYYKNNYGVKKLIRFLKKTAKREKLITTNLIFDEFISKIFKKWQKKKIRDAIYVENVKINLVNFEKKLEEKGICLEKIKDSHIGRSQARLNDLSLIYLFQKIHVEKKYIVTNDQGILAVINELSGDYRCFIRSYTEYTINMKILERTGRRSVYEQPYQMVGCQ